jgi:hypothetical protein
MITNKYLEKIAGLIRSFQNLESKTGSHTLALANRIRKEAAGFPVKEVTPKSKFLNQTLNNQLNTGLYKKALLGMKPLGKLPMFGQNQGAPRFALSKSNPKKIGGTSV